MSCFDVFARRCAGAPFAVSFGRCGDTAAQLLVVMLWHAMARQYVVLLSGSYSPGAFCGHVFFMGSHRERTCMKCFGTMKAFVEQLAMLTAMFP